MNAFIWLRSKLYAFKCGDGSKNKLKGVSKSQSKNNKFEEYRNCLHGKKYQEECKKYILRSIIHEIHLQELKISSVIYIILKLNHGNNIIKEL